MADLEEVLENSLVTGLAVVNTDCFIFMIIAERVRATTESGKRPWILNSSKCHETKPVRLITLALPNLLNPVRSSGQGNDETQAVLERSVQISPSRYDSRFSLPVHTLASEFHV